MRESANSAPGPVAAESTWPATTTVPTGEPGAAPADHQPTTRGSSGMVRPPSGSTSTGNTGAVSRAPLRRRPSSVSRSGPKDRSTIAPRSALLPEPALVGDDD